MWRLMSKLLSSNMFYHLKILQMAKWFVNREKKGVQAAFLEEAWLLRIGEGSHLSRVLLPRQDHLHLRLRPVAQHIPSLNNHLGKPMMNQGIL